MPAVLLMGATASGKSQLSMWLAERLPVEIISVDSAQVYRGMDIGTAKPTPEERARAPHHLLDILDPTEAYSAARFVDDAKALMREIRSRGRLPLLVGGTMLYFRALRFGLSDLPQADAALRHRLEEEAALQGWPALHERLAALDPETAARLHPNDQQRIQRALEIVALTGEPASELFSRGTLPGCAEPVLPIALQLGDRARLHLRIAERFDQMMASGLAEEVAALYRRGDLNREMPSIRCVGYRQLWDHYAGACSMSEAVDRAIAATRQFAKRQLTWLRSDSQLSCYEAEDPAMPEAVLARIVQGK